MADLLRMIQKAIKTSGQTRYRIAKEAGVAQSQLSRLMSGERGLRVETVQKLVDYLGLEIIIQPKRQRKGGK